MKKHAFLFGILLVFFTSKLCYGWSDKYSHPKLTTHALQSSDIFILPTYLANVHHLDLTKIPTVDERSLVDFFIFGSEVEDNISLEGGARALNHFHDPTKNTYEAGLRNKLLSYNIGGMSAVAWAEADNANWWTLKSFFSSLESSFNGLREEDRAAFLAQAFKAAGHLTHLLQDMAVPAHVRNQLRIGHTGKLTLKSLPPVSSAFEYFLAENPFFIKSVEPPSIPSFDSFTDYYDTGYYRMNFSESVTGNAVGLAEYTNSNYFSEFQTVGDGGSIWPQAYPNPALDDFFYHNSEDDTAQKYPHLRFLLPNTFYSAYVGRSSGNPENTFVHLGRRGYFYSNVASNNAVFLDEECYKEYLTKLVPKAVAYSAGLLEFLFRGDIDFYVNLLNSEATIVNNSDESIDGSFRFFHDDENGWREEIAVPVNLALGPGDQVTVPLSITNMPERTVEHTLTILFKGRQGAQQGFVTGNTNTFFPYEM